jgi:two-component system, chemotaxis family, protein-glutamate methylesterase/glutaminase
VAYRIVVIGTSWGGLQALRCIGTALPRGYPLPVVAVQHRHRDSDHLLQQLLQDTSVLPVSEVEDKEPMRAGHLYIAPPDYHLLIEDGDFALSTDAPVRFSRPSIDVTFASAANALGAGVIGVVLTGANADGAEGLRRIVQRGGRAIVQSPDSAESAIMPAAAMRAVPEAEVLPLDRIGPRLVELAVESPAFRARRLRAEREQPGERR